MTDHRIHFAPEGPVAHLSPDVMDVVWSSAAAVINAIKAEAWAEGYALGVDDERTSADNVGIAGFGMKVNPARNNPYAPLSRSRKE